MDTLTLTALLTICTFALSCFADSSDDSNRCVDASDKRYELDDKMITANFWYVCQAPLSGSGRPSLRRMGCVGSSNSLIDIGSKFQTNGLTYECQLIPGGVFKPKIVGCANFAGAQVQNGEVYIRANYAYLCNITVDGKVQNRVVGCANPDFEQMADGDRFISGQYFYQCSMKNSGDWLLEVAGCVDDEGNMVDVGKNWINPDRVGLTFVYRFYCVKNEKGEITIEERSAEERENDKLQLSHPQHQYFVAVVI